MNRNLYQNAVDHLVFSDRLQETVMKQAEKPHYGYRVARIAALAAVMVCMLATTVLAVNQDFRTWIISKFNSELRHVTQAEGVTVHYLELDKANYSFVNGVICSPQAGFLRFTEDHRLEPVEMSQLNIALEKNGRNYTEGFGYYETESGIVSSFMTGLQKNQQGEIFLNPSDGNSHQWPVYVNLETGEVRDALPAWTEEDFPGREAYSYELMGGILLCTIVDEDYNMLYWIGPDAKEAVVLDLPADHYSWYCENNRLYYRDSYGRLYRMNEKLEFDLVCDYATGDDLTNGLYTVATDKKELAIVDVYTGDTYVIPGYKVNPGAPAGVRARVGGDIDETMGYNATRYNAEGRIVMVQTVYDWQNKRVALQKLGVLSEETGELMLLEIENEYDSFHIQWMDEKHLAVIYDRKYLYIYEFE